MYRLITCGTVEEKIYRKQVFKTALFRSGVSTGTAQRYFSQQVRAEWESVLICSPLTAGG